MLVGKCPNAHTVLSANRYSIFTQRCCSLICSIGYQQAHVAQAAARTSAASEVFQSGIVTPVAGQLSGLFQRLPSSQSELSAQAALNERLKRCTSWEELAALLDANLDILDFVNISTTWTRLAKRFESSGPPKDDVQGPVGTPPVRHPVFRRFFSRLIDVTSQQLRLFGVQALANVMWALSNADWHLEQHEPAVSQLVHNWCSQLLERLPELRAPDVSNISTAIGRLDHRWCPDFVVEFYRSVLQRADLMEHLDVTTLNNLLYGMSRARRRGFVLGPATRQTLAQCVDRTLERSVSGLDQESVSGGSSSRGLVPWRAAQLLDNCHKLRLPMRTSMYAVLMPIVAKVYACETNTMDCWSMGFLVSFVDAHRRIHPAVRPDVRPLYSYVERRMPEASTSQLAMLAHAFRDLGCAPPAPFWGQLFFRYLPKATLPHAPQPPPQRPRLEHAHIEEDDQQQKRCVESGDGRSVHLQQVHTLRVEGPIQHRFRGISLQPPSRSPDGLAQHDQEHSTGYKQQHPVFLQQQGRLQQRSKCLMQQQVSLEQQQQVPQPLTRGGPLAHPSQQSEPHCRTSVPIDQSTRPIHSPSTSHPPPYHQRLLPHAARQLQEKQLFLSQSSVELQTIQERKNQQQPLQLLALQSQQRQQQGLPIPPKHWQPALHSRPPYPGVVLSAQTDTSPGAKAQVSYPASASGSTSPFSPPSFWGLHTTEALDRDDLAEPRTLHFVCWQAAKAGILPPRVFLRLYVEHVPQWLVNSADDRQVAQVVETLQLLRWVPRWELRDKLCITLERRKTTSRLPMRALLRWVHKQR